MGSSVVAGISHHPVAKVLLLSFAVLLLSCSRPAPPPVSAHVPAGADAALLLPDLDRFLPALLAFADGMEGSEDLFAWLATPLGVDLRAPEALAAAGFDGRAGLAIVLQGGVLCGVAGVADSSRAARHLRRQAPVLGFRRETTGGASSVVSAWSAGAGRAGGLALGVSEEAAVLCVRMGEGEAPVAQTRALLSPASAPLAADPGFLRAAGPESPEALRVFARPARTLFAPSRIDPLLSGAGLGAIFLRSLLGGFDGFGGSLRFAPRGLSAALRLVRPAEVAALPEAWFAGEGGTEGFAALLPASTSVLLQTRVSVDTLRELPPFLKGAIPASPALGGLHPYLAGLDTWRDLVPLWDGRVAVAILGLAPGATMATIVAAMGDPRALPRAFSFGLLFGISVPQEIGRLAERQVARALSLGRNVAHTPVAGSPSPAWLLEGATSAGLYVGLRGDTAFAVVGREDFERMMRVVEGRAPSLLDRAHSALDREAVRGEGLATVHVSFDRIARQLACQGFPPYFLGILSSPDAVAARLNVGAHELSLELEVSQ